GRGRATRGGRRADLSDRGDRREVHPRPLSDPHPVNECQVLAAEAQLDTQHTTRSLQPSALVRGVHLMANRDKPIQVLIADDMADTRDNLEKLLSFEDDIVVAGRACDGQEAVDRARELLPDVILMDINMPVMDGIQAAELISSELPTCQVIMMSVQG